MGVKSRPDGGAMELILQRWIDSVRERMAAERGVAMNNLPPSDVVERLRMETSEMSGMTFYQDFAAVVSAY